MSLRFADINNMYIIHNIQFLVRYQNYFKIYPNLKFWSINNILSLWSCGQVLMPNFVLVFMTLTCCHPEINGCFCVNILLIYIHQWGKFQMNKNKGHKVLSLYEFVGKWFYNVFVAFIYNSLSCFGNKYQCVRVPVKT